MTIRALLLACSDMHTYRQDVCFAFFLNLQLKCYKNDKITYPRNVTCSSEQLFIPYQTVFFKNDNWRVYGVILKTYKSNIYNYGNKMKVTCSISSSFVIPRSKTIIFKSLYTGLTITSIFLSNPMFSLK